MSCDFKKKSKFEALNFLMEVDCQETVGALQ